MPTLRFEFDWAEAERVKGPELSATWATLQIKVADSPVTRVLDTRAKTVRDFIYVPLYPLAEWLVANWWFLVHECGSPAREGSTEFRRRHTLIANREGYAFPDFEVVPAGSRTRLTWRRNSSHWSRIEFLNEGESWVDSSDVQETCGEFITQVIRRLLACGIDDTLLQAEWEAIQAADEDEAKFCATAAGLGWHPYTLNDVMERWVFFYDERLGQLLEEALPALDTDDLLENKMAVRNIRWAIPETKKFHSIPLERLRSLATDLPAVASTHRNPWYDGYALARQLRARLNIENSPLPTLKDLARAFGEDDTLLEKSTRPVGFLPRFSMIDGLVTRTDDHQPAFGLRQLGEEQRRFHFCRCIAESLTHPGSDTLITRAYTERQQRNRAFAAEFLAPSSGLREKIAHNVVDSEIINELATDFGVSSLVVEHQIVNHRIATVLL